MAAQHAQMHNTIDHVLFWHVGVRNALAVVQQHACHLHGHVAHVGERHVTVAVGRDDGIDERLQAFGHVVDFDACNAHVLLIGGGRCGRLRASALNGRRITDMPIDGRIQGGVALQKRAAGRRAQIAARQALRTGGQVRQRARGEEPQGEKGRSGIHGKQDVRKPGQCRAFRTSRREPVRLSAGAFCDSRLYRRGRPIVRPYTTSRSTPSNTWLFAASL